jgi:uncharacterized protein (DUF1501 family)
MEETVNSQETNEVLSHPECSDWRRLADNPLEAMLRTEAAAVEVENEAERNRFLEMARDEEMQQECQAVTRRRILVGAGAAVTALTTAQWVSTSASFAATPTGTLIQVFCYGGTDGLAVMASNDDMPFLRTKRAGVLLPDNALAIDRNFRLSPALAPLEAMVRSNNAAFIPGVSDPRLNRSHFAATDVAQLGGAPADVGGNGWLDNLIGVLGPGTAFRGVSIGNTLTRSLVGQNASLALNNVGSLNINGPGQYRDATLKAIQTLFNATDHPVELAVKAGIDALNLARQLSGQRYQPANGANYGGNGVGNAFQTLAQLIKGGGNVRVATVSHGGFDTHENQGGNGNGYLVGRLNQLATAINGFFTDLGPAGANVTVLVNTEFGRRVSQNGSGTDHGHGGTVWVVSGKKLAGNVLGNWGGLNQAIIDRAGGDVPEYNNMFQIFGSLAQGRFGLTNAEVQKIFPRMKFAPMRLFA